MSAIDSAYTFSSYSYVGVRLSQSQFFFIARVHRICVAGSIGGIDDVSFFIHNESQRNGCCRIQIRHLQIFIQRNRECITILLYKAFSDSPFAVRSSLLSSFFVPAVFVPCFLSSVFPAQAESAAAINIIQSNIPILFFLIRTFSISCVSIQSLQHGRPVYILHTEYIPYLRPLSYPCGTDARTGHSECTSPHPPQFPE